jgi:hypothetical protein
MRRMSILGFALAAFLVVGGCKGKESAADTTAVPKSATATPTPSPTPDPTAKGDCKTGGKTTTGKTKDECDSLGGNWTANKPTASPSGTSTPRP